MFLNFKLHIESIKKLFFIFLTFLFLNNSFIFADFCNDEIALNYDSDYDPESTTFDDCIYFDIPNTLYTDEDTIYEVDLLTFASGPYEESEFVFTQSYNCDNMTFVESCVITDSVLKIEFTENYYGNAQFPQLLYQYNEISFYESFQVSVNPINDPPEIIISDSLDLEASRGILFQYTINVDDPDNNNFSFELIDSPFEASIINHSNLAIFSYTPDDEYPYVSCLDENDGLCFSFEVKVEDYAEPLGVDSHVFYVKIVNEPNDLPILSANIITSESNRLEDNEINLGINIDDDDFLLENIQVVSVYSRSDQHHHQSQIVNVDSAGEFDFKSNFMPYPDWNGTFTIKVIADDIYGSVIEEIPITLAPVNDTPSVSGLNGISYPEGNCTVGNECVQYTNIIDPDQSAFENEDTFDFLNLEYALEWVGDSEQHLDGDQYIVGDFERHGSNNYVTDYFHVTNNDWFGVEYFKITVSDDENASYETIFPVTIVNDNDSPLILDEIPDATIEEEGELTISINAEDIDSEQLNYIVQGDFISSEDMGLGAVKITPNLHYNGIVDISVEVNDNDLSDFTEFTLNITAVNDHPLTKDLFSFLTEDDQQHLIDLNGAINLCSDLVYDNSGESIRCNCDSNDFTQGSCDIEDINLSYKLHSQPSVGILVDENNITINLGDNLNGSILFYTPNPNQDGSDSFDYEVCDTENLCEFGKVELIIEGVNDPPIVNDMMIDLNEDQADFQIELIANDLEGNELTYQVTVPPEHATSFSQPVGNIMSYLPELDFFGEDIFYFSVSDGLSVTDASCILNIAPVNDSPVLETLPDISFNEGGSDILVLSASDVDDTELTYSVTEGTDITASLDVYTITFSASENYNGSENFTVSVTDGDLTDSQVITVTITSVNDQPVIEDITNIGNQSCMDVDNICLFNEDESFNLIVNADDVDEDNLFFSIIEEEYFSVVTSENNFELKAYPHYYGPIEIPFKVCDRDEQNIGDDMLCVEQTISININSVNDLPLAKKIFVNISEECPTEINIDGTIIVDSDDNDPICEDNPICEDELINGVLCNCLGEYGGDAIEDCQLPSITQGVCDIESSELIYEIVYGPDHGTAQFIAGTSIIHYDPDIDYISEINNPDIIQYKITDSNSQTNEEVVFNDDGQCADVNNCPIIEITVGSLNDSPIINCPNDNCEVSLSELLVIYEDCSEEENFENTLCDIAPGITVEELRVGYGDIESDICSNNHLWHDVDCQDLVDVNEFSFGVAVDVSSAEDDNNRGIWKYKKYNEENFIAFDSDGNCNYQLLSKNDDIKFYPNSNYYTTSDNIPKLIFNAWDETEYCIDEDDDGNCDDKCISSLKNRDDSCDVDSGSFSSNYLTASWNIVSVNDSPHSSQIVDQTISEHCPIEDNPDCSQQVHEVLIDFSDPYDYNESFFSDDMYYLVSSKTISSNNEQSLFTNLEFTDNFLELSNLANENLEFNEEILLQKDDGLYLQLKLTEYANGEAEVTIVGFDRENLEEGLDTVQTFTVNVNQVNNKIKEFALVPNIYNYEDYITNSDMIFPYNPTENDELYIKYPPYKHENETITIDDITAENFSVRQQYMLENPYKMEELYFMWERSFENGFLDYDIDPLLNENPYLLYFRLEFINEDGHVYVLADSIIDSFSGFEKAYIGVEFSDKEYKTYILGEGYNPQTEERDKLNTAGLTFYKWRVVGDNYVDVGVDFDPDYDFQNTATTLSYKQYAVNLHIPNIKYDFILNDIYTNYFDLYISPYPIYFTGERYYENILFNQNSEVYLDYYGNGILDDEILVLESLQFESDLVSEQNIYRSYDDFNEYGSLVFKIPVQNEVGTINLDSYYATYEQIEPNTFNELISPMNQFSLEFVSNNQFNILMHEEKKDYVLLNDNSINVLSDLLVIDANSDYLLSNMKIKFNLDSITQFDNNITFAKYNNGLIEEINSSIDDNILSAAINEFGSFIVVSTDDNIFDDEIPYETKIISCYPNPFNPFTVINYKLDKDRYVEFEIYNIQGKMLFNSEKIYTSKGENEYTWNGKNNYGHSLSSGVYLVTMKTDDKFYSQKITLLK